jgi:pSer/pThr/pTyr-binding forkhead associated (FHA) protein/serine/threonine protein phosphatase PrpC
MDARLGHLHVQVTGGSARGATHEREGTDNQDAYTWRPVQPGLVGSEAFTVAVADGHGSAKSPRSQVGARLAVDIATELLQARLPRIPPGEGITPPLRELLSELTERWADAVREDIRRNPLDRELRRLQADGRIDSAARAELAANNLVAYGATLLVAAITETAVYYLQMGDGDILAVSSDGEVSRPVPGDHRLFGNETTSLCLPKAWQHFRVSSASLQDAPRLILLSSDGYANSFESDDAFLQVGSDLLRMIEQEGIKPVESSLKDWLSETTRLGAGDDVTLALVSLVSDRHEMDGQPKAPVVAPASWPTRGSDSVAPTELQSAIPNLPDADQRSHTPSLSVRIGDQQHTLTSDRSWTVGRGEHVDIRTGNRSVSQRHAVLQARRGQWSLEDVGSKQGTYDAGGQRVQRVAISGPVKVWLGRPGEGDEVELAVQGVSPPSDQRLQRIMLGVGTIVLLLIATLVLFGRLDHRAGSGSNEDRGPPSAPLATVQQAAVSVSPSPPGQDAAPVAGRSGSGVIVSPDGLILASARVAAPAALGQGVLYGRSVTEINPKRLTVKLATRQGEPAQRTYTATVRAADGYLGLAVLKIDADGDGNPIDSSRLKLPHVTMGNAASLKAGARLTSVGFPSARQAGARLVEQTVLGMAQDARISGQPGWIEVDHAVVDGDGTEGGPAVDPTGQLVGVQLAIRPDQAVDNPNRGALRPINVTKALIERARAGSPWISPYVKPLTGDEKLAFVGWAGQGSSGCAVRQPVASYPSGAKRISAVFRGSGLSDGVDLMYQVHAVNGQGKTTGAAIGTQRLRWDGGDKGCIRFDATAAFGDGTYKAEAYAGPNYSPIAEALVTIGQ